MSYIPLLNPPKNYWLRQKNGNWLKVWAGACSMKVWAWLKIAVHVACYFQCMYFKNFFSVGEHIVKRDNKRPFRTSLKYDKEIRDEVETEGRDLSDLQIYLAQEILRRHFTEILGLEDTSLRIFGKFTSHEDEFWWFFWKRKNNLVGIESCSS